MQNKKLYLILGVCIAAALVMIAAVLIILRANDARIEFSIPEYSVETVEFGGEWTAPEVKAYLKGNIFNKSGKEIEVTREGDANTSELGEYRIVYSASADLVSGSAEYVVKVVDTTPPVITLAAAKSEFLYVGDTYAEAGFTATDAVDGDLTGSVTATDIDTSTPGQKEITYTVTDQSGNVCTATRTVVVREKPAPTQVIDSPPSTGGGVIYLTFDDGPSAYTATLLDILKKYNVKATFFVTGSGDRSLIAREAAEGHSVGIHTLTHEYSKIYASVDAYFADLNAVNEIIKEQTGEYSKLVRFPGGSSNTVSKKYCKGIMTQLAAELEAKGYKYFDWNVSSGDAGGTTVSDTVYTNVINGVRGKAYSIVLQHDIKNFSVNAVERIIVWGLNNGYTFAPLTPDSPTVHQHINN
ncbi:MAG: polysaccharide deacetylase family protein [Clostridia bacterium]|nr:polysaccharide deacetylase family protein [Clostridia bacterium]